MKNKVNGIKEKVVDFVDDHSDEILVGVYVLVAVASIPLTIAACRWAANLNAKAITKGLLDAGIGK